MKKLNTLKDKKDFLKKGLEMVKKNPEFIGKKITNKNVYQIFKINYPDYDKKITPGLDYISINYDMFGNLCYHIHLTDGNTDDISVNMLRKNTTSVNNSKTFVLRYLIGEQILLFRKNNLGKKCPITGEIMNTGNIEIHHDYPSFSKICDDWIKINNINLSREPVIGNRFVNENLNNSFETYHRDNCNLIALSKKAHKMVKNITHTQSYLRNIKIQKLKTK